MNIQRLAPFENVLTESSLVLHADVLQDPPGGRIVAEIMSINLVQTNRFKTQLQHRSRCFGCVATAPLFRIDPVAKLGPVMGEFKDEADTTDEYTAVAQADRPVQAPAIFITILHPIDEFRCCTIRVRMRNVQRRCRDVSARHEFS